VLQLQSYFQLVRQGFVDSGGTASTLLPGVIHYRDYAGQSGLQPLLCGVHTMWITCMLKLWSGVSWLGGSRHLALLPCADADILLHIPGSALGLASWPQALYLAGETRHLSAQRRSAHPKLWAPGMVPVQRVSRPLKAGKQCHQAQCCTAVPSSSSSARPVRT
jgi:hypothetical protein